MPISISKPVFQQLCTRLGSGCCSPAGRSFMILWLLSEIGGLFWGCGGFEVGIKLPTPFSGLFEVSDTIFVLGRWDQNIGNY